MAENTGFEPADALTSTVFKTAALNHSANSPHLFLRRSENRCNGLPKQNARFVLSFCWVNESARLEDFSIYLGLRPKTAALNHSTGPHICFCVGQKTVATVCQNETHGLILSFVGSLLISENSVANKTRFGKHFLKNFMACFGFSSYCCFYLSWVLQNQFLFVIIEQKR